MRFFHLHKYTPIDVQHMRYTLGDGDATLILKQCSCGKVRTDTVTGHWPAERFLPKREATP